MTNHKYDNLRGGALAVGSYYMHKNAMDVAFLVTAHTGGTEVLQGYRALPVNLGYAGKPWFIDQEPRTYGVLNVDHSNWVCIDGFVRKKRVKPGLPEGVLNTSENI